ncbi:hypothetical protein [Novosphingobium olei]|uniref:hypothetical protein n=1 Tax=Novosphingobium olei TaxID=2728851 RepID=UPI00308D33E8|nr:hypothetical protein NSDW_21280 [Novosphingobium olei]
MSDHTEERLAAYLDGAMTADEEAAFDREIAADVVLARLALERRDRDRQLADRAPRRTPSVEPEIVERLSRGHARPQTVAAPRPGAWSWKRLAMIVAAMAMVAAGVVSALRPRAAKSAADPVSLALEGTPSGRTAHLADGRMLTPVLTVRAADGSWCREYTLARASGLACRRNGRWVTEAQGDAASSGNSAPSPAIEDAYRRIGATSPLGADEEMALVGNWD